MNAISDRNGKGQFLPGHPNFWGRKISRALTGRKLSEQHKTNIGKAFKGDKHPLWRGGRIVGSGGYVYIYSPNHPRHDKDGYVPEHNLIAEKVLGRYLKPGEMVHHVNCNRQDNRNKNLVICTKAYNNFLHARMRRLQCL